MTARTGEPEPAAQSTLNTPLHSSQSSEHSQHSHKYNVIIRTLVTLTNTPALLRAFLETAPVLLPPSADSLLCLHSPGKQVSQLEKLRSQRRPDQ